MKKHDKKVIKEEIAKFRKENKEKEKRNNERVNYRWIIRITVFAFIISLFFSLISEKVIPSVNIYIGILLVFIFISLGVIFDIIGVAITSADEEPFHSMSAKKIKPARIAVILKKNADKVSSFCNDVIGDICGIISGSAGAIIAETLVIKYHFDLMFTNLIIMALIAALTIGGKAIGKGFAIKKCNIILYNFAKVISQFYNGKR